MGSNGKDCFLESAWQLSAPCWSCHLCNITSFWHFNMYTCKSKVTILTLPSPPSQCYVQSCAVAGVTTIVLHMEKSQQMEQLTHCKPFIFLLSCSSFTWAMYSKQKKPLLLWLQHYKDHVKCHCSACFLRVCIHISINSKQRGKASQRNLISFSSTTSHPYFLP